MRCKPPKDQRAHHPAAELAAAGADLLIAISSSPYRGGILPRRLYHAARTGLPLVYVNAVGANDELIFDGRSFVMDEKGALAARLPGFREAVEVVDLEASPAPEPFVEPPPEEELFEALCLGVRDFVAKNNLRRVFLGLSGGVDSALVACIAAAAVVFAVLPITFLRESNITVDFLTDRLPPDARGLPRRRSRPGLPVGHIKCVPDTLTLRGLGVVRPRRGNLPRICAATLASGRLRDFNRQISD